MTQQTTIPIHDDAERHILALQLIASLPAPSDKELAVSQLKIVIAAAQAALGADGDCRSRSFSAAERQE